MPEIRAYSKLFGEGLAARLVFLRSVFLERSDRDQPDRAPAVDFNLPPVKLALPQKTADMAHRERVFLRCLIRGKEIPLFHDPILYRFDGQVALSDFRSSKNRITSSGSKRTYLPNFMYGIADGPCMVL